MRCRIMWKAHPCSTLSDVAEIALEYEVIGIDEGQFVRFLNSLNLLKLSSFSFPILNVLSNYTF